MKSHTQVKLQLWTSSFSLINFQNVIIRTTLSNTISDVKDVIWKRSQESIEAEIEQSGNNQSGAEAIMKHGKLLHPTKIKLYYKNEELTDSGKLERYILENDAKCSGDFVSLRIEAQKLSADEPYHYSDYKEPLVDIVFNGKSEHAPYRILGRESINSTFSSLKSFILDELNIKKFEHLKTGKAEDIHLLASVNLKREIGDSSIIGQQSLSGFLKLDTIPPFPIELDYDLELDVNFLKEYNKSVVEIRLLYSGVLSHIIKAKNIKISPELTVKDIKRKIISIQDTSEVPNLLTDDIKLIFQGKVLTDEQQIKPALKLNGLGNLAFPINIHFSINITYFLENDLLPKKEQRREESIWEQIKNGSAFEFLPKRDERGTVIDLVASSMASGSHEYLANDGSSGLTNLHSTDVIHLNSSLNAQQSNLLKNTPPGHKEFKREGTLFDLVSSTKGNKGYFAVDQKRLLTKLITMSVRLLNGKQKEVILSSSQAIINNSNPKAPYIMLSPAGYAELSKIGVPIDPPKLKLNKAAQRTNNTPISGSSLSSSAQHTPNFQNTDSIGENGYNRVRNFSRLRFLNIPNHTYHQNNPSFTVHNNVGNTAVNNVSNNNTGSAGNSATSQSILNSNTGHNMTTHNANHNIINNNLNNRIDINGAVFQSFRTGNLRQYAVSFTRHALTIGKYILVILILFAEVDWSQNIVSAIFLLLIIFIYLIVRLNILETVIRALEPYGEQSALRSTVLSISRTLHLLAVNGQRNFDRIFEYCCKGRVYHNNDSHLENYILDLDDNAIPDEDAEQQIVRVGRVKIQVLDEFRDKIEARAGNSIKDVMEVIFKDILLSVLLLFPPFFEKFKQIVESDINAFHKEIKDRYTELALEEQQRSQQGREFENGVSLQSAPDEQLDRDLGDSKVTSTGFTRAGDSTTRDRAQGTNGVLSPDNNVGNVSFTNGNDIESDDATTVSDTSEITISDPINNTNSDTDTEEHMVGSFR